jgi:hypothetical protein
LRRDGRVRSGGSGGRGQPGDFVPDRSATVDEFLMFMVLDR